MRTPGAASSRMTARRAAPEPPLLPRARNLFRDVASLSMSAVDVGGNGMHQAGYGRWEGGGSGSGGGGGGASLADPAPYGCSIRLCGRDGLKLVLLFKVCKAEPFQNRPTRCAPVFARRVSRRRWAVGVVQMPLVWTRRAAAPRSNEF